MFPAARVEIHTELQRDFESVRKLYFSLLVAEARNNRVRMTRALDKTQLPWWS